MNSMAMEHSIKQEDLLRHLLNAKKCATKDEFVYTVLLGFRLFLSPRQLLTELNRLALEDATSTSRNYFAADECSRCGRKQKNIPDIKSPKKALLEEASTSESGPKRIVSMLFPASSRKDGEDTLRRKRRGRKRIQSGSTPEEVENSTTEKMDCTSPPSSPTPDNPKMFSTIVEIKDAKNNSALNNNSSAPFRSSRYCLKCRAMSKNEVALASKKQLVRVLFEWVRHFPADFRNKKILWALNDVIRSCQSENEELRRICTNVLDSVSRLTAAQESYEHQLNEMEQCVLVKKSNKYRKTTDWMLHLVLDMTDLINVTEMAQQLCLVETDFLKHVGAEEFLQLFTADGDEDPKTNLGACVRWFNRLSHLVATIVCLCRKQKQAKQVITFFARVANRCFEISNFNSSMAILSGLSSGPVTRLKKVWDKFELPELEKLQSVFDPSNNFLKYRSIYLSRADKLQSSSSPLPDKMKSANRFSVASQHSVASVASTNSQHIDSGFESEHEVKVGGVFRFQESMKHFTFDPTRAPQDSVMVPFLVLLVKDVYFLNHSIETIEQDGSINFEKLNTLAHILRPLEEWKQMLSSYQKVDEIQDFLLRAPVHNDDELYLLSYKREPPTNRFEKQQLKTLKTEQAARKNDELVVAT